MLTTDLHEPLALPAHVRAEEVNVSGVPCPSALEEAFPGPTVSIAAEQESWRKEVHRPATHTHKWWAQRLGVVFRGILTSATALSEEEAETRFSSATTLPGLRVFDPFAGSGTTLAEAVKLGGEVVGRDINPVATLVQRQAIARWDREALLAAFSQVEKSCRDEIDSLHVTQAGEAVLYYFWVAVAACPICSDKVDLFSSHIFARHAYPQRVPAAKALCPSCDTLVDVDLKRDKRLSCAVCGRASEFDGPASGPHMLCRRGHRSRIVDALAGTPPRHRPFAKLVLTEEKSREYRGIDEFDRALMDRAADLLDQHRADLVLPQGELSDGYNTRQAMRWGYERWEQFFSSRQLYCLGLLGAAIRDLSFSPEREALATLLSGTLEFNNMFCSYKGEGTGAVRHMFSHHILKPERVPLEAHPWGTPASSGSFSTLFASRILRAFDYKVAPHDITLRDGKVTRSRKLSVPMGRTIVDNYDSLAACPEGTAALIASGDSSSTDLPNESIDLVVTDPPFLDNVHYSELADFFHAWLRRLQPFDGYPCLRTTTRMQGEVQSESSTQFEEAITRVWKECHRVLKDEGILAFTFHHSRTEGWLALMRSLLRAGFAVTSVQPVKAEMTTSAAKAGAAASNNLDAIVVCRKRGSVLGYGAKSPEEAKLLTRTRLDRLALAGITVGRADEESITKGAVLALLTRSDRPFGERALLDFLCGEGAPATGEPSSAPHLELLAVPDVNRL